ncbi:hypothetical protein B879_00533 [Cecembia lonarensis LW9]|uniref:Uncharacterized protein n=1 Tax=Cecembia lonarensis (strain CCUG 58316 / KCTC 22772 / LW9) TaxID=1225176 RepID=K1LKD8_CECL9|nr:hypothetical protein B879_00533 [Cecembia lonarensis LW9]
MKLDWTKAFKNKIIFCSNRLFKEVVKQKLDWETNEK